MFILMGTAWQIQIHQTIQDSKYFSGPHIII